MMIIDVIRDAWVITQSLELAKTIRIMGIHDDQSRDLAQVQIVETSHPEIMDRQEPAHRVLSSARENDDGAGVQVSTSHHRGQAVKIRIEMGGNDIHGEVRYSFNAVRASLFLFPDRQAVEPTPVFPVRPSPRCPTWR